MIDLSPWPIPIPSQFSQVRYVGNRIPGSANQSDLLLGANCQVYAYALLQHFGLSVPNFRSSELWQDEIYTQKVSGALQPLDLMLYHHQAQAFGAHIGLYWGEGLVLHLAKQHALPKLEPHSSLLEQEKYAHFIGAKRIRLI